MSDRVIDWAAVRAEYEAGQTLRALSAKYDIPKTTLIRRRDGERWTRMRTTDRTGPSATPIRLPTHTPVPAPSGALDIARSGLRLLGNLVNDAESLTLSEHKLLADSLSQYVKVLITAPAQEEPREDGLFIRLDKISEQGRAEIRAILVKESRVS